MKDITGGITKANVWFYMVTITVILSAILFMQRQASKQVKSDSSGSLPKTSDKEL